MALITPSRLDFMMILLLFHSNHVNFKRDRKELSIVRFSCKTVTFFTAAGIQFSRENKIEIVLKENWKQNTVVII